MKSRAVKGVDGQEQGTGTKFPAENNSWFLWLAWREIGSQSPILQRAIVQPNYTRGVEQRCTCGAVLAADSRFCHKCGKPQYEEDVERLAALEAEMKPVATPVPEPVAVPVPIGIGNLRAVGVTMSVAALAFVCMLLASVVAPPIVPIILCAAGFAAARFYKGNSSISAFAGAVLGTMTGMWLFLVFAVCAAMASYSLESPEGQQMMKAFSPKITPDVARILQDPHQMVTGLLLPTFFLLVISAAFGGLLAARFRWRGRQQ